MRTLSIIANELMQLPYVIDCPKMTIMGFEDFEEPIFEGSGQIEINTRNLFWFRMHAKTQDTKGAIKKINRMQTEPFNHKALFDYLLQIIGNRNGLVVDFIT